MRRQYERMNVPTELARAFVTVSDTLSFTRTAKLLGVTQPAVTGQIKRLEGIIGAALIDREASGVQLTQVGHLVLDHARDLLEANKMMLSVAGHGSPSACRIAATSAFLEPFLTEFMRTRDRPPIHVKCVPSEEVARLLHHGQADVGLLLLSDPSLGTVLEWQEELVWVKTEALRLDEDQPVPLIASPSKYSDRRMMEALDRLGLRYDLVVNCPDYDGRLAAARLGLGATIAFARTDFSPLVVAREDWLPRVAPMRAAICLRGGLRERTVPLIVSAARRAFDAPTQSAEQDTRRH